MYISECYALAFHVGQAKYFSTAPLQVAPDFSTTDHLAASQRILQEHQDTTKQQKSVVAPGSLFKKAGALHLETEALRIFQVGKDLRRSVVLLLASGMLLRTFSRQVMRTSKNINEIPALTLNFFKCNESKLPDLLQVMDRGVEQCVPVQTSHSIHHWHP